MATADELLHELGQLASDIGPAVRPAHTDELLTALTESARRLFGAAACSLAILSDDESELVYTTAAGAGADDVTGMRIPSNQGIAGWVVQSGQPIAISDLANDARFNRQVAEETGYLPQSIVAVPVTSPRRTLGVISLLDRDPSRPDAAHDMTMLSLFADQAAIALESVMAFTAMGSVLLAALAAGAAEGSDLAAAVRLVADDGTAADPDLAALAATFAGLARAGAPERRLALDVLRAFAGYAERRSTRTR